MSQLMSQCQLQDKSKPGSSRMLTFLLIDPERRVVSTERVPPQQGTWYACEAKQVLCNLPTVPELPIEIADHVSSFLNDWPMSIKLARMHRTRLLQARDFPKRDSTLNLLTDLFDVAAHVGVEPREVIDYDEAETLNMP
ncbi:MAG: hypothetical protein MHM6MM_004221 [Cercozoa sp. M6MM]